jgi:tetratricopeptide (TPR) repeat protein
MRDQGRYSEAIEYYDKALELNPNDISASINALSGKGNILRDQGRYTEAIEYYDKALALNKHAVKALVDKGIALIRQNNYLDCKCHAHMLMHGIAKE